MFIERGYSYSTYRRFNRTCETIKAAYINWQREVNQLDNFIYGVRWQEQCLADKFNHNQTRFNNIFGKSKKIPYLCRNI